MVPRNIINLPANAEGLGGVFVPTFCQTRCRWRTVKMKSKYRSAFVDRIPVSFIFLTVLFFHYNINHAPNIQVYHEEKMMVYTCLLKTNPDFHNLIIYCGVVFVHDKHKIHIGHGHENGSHRYLCCGYMFHGALLSNKIYF